MEKKKSWVDNPSKKQASVVFFVWFIGVTLFILSATDFFTESLLHKENWVSGMLFISSTVSMMPVCINYIKNRKDKQLT